MKRYIKKFAAAIMAAVMMLSTSITGFAENNPYTENDFIEKLNEDIIYYLLSTGCDMNNNFYISNLFEVQNWGAESTTDYISFVFMNDEIIGNIKLSTSNNNITTSYSFDNFGLTNYNNSSIGFGFTGESFLMYNESTGKYYTISTKTDNITFPTEIVITDKITKKYLVFNKNSRASVPSYLGEQVLTVPNVNNSTINGGICWAACIAMKTNYEGYTSNASATSIYNLVNNDMPDECSSIPSYTGANGCTNCIMKGYELANYSNCTVLENSRVVADARIFTPDFIFAQLQDNTVIHINIRDDDDNAHSIVITGIKIYNTQSVVIFNDPNRNSSQAVIINVEPLTYTTSFVYQDDYYTYNEVYRTFY